MSDVVIAGAGPVGLITALGLARAGVSVTVLEAENEIKYTPRAISYAWSIFPGLQLLGVLDDMLATGEIVDARSWRIFGTGEEIVYDHAAVRGVTDRPYSLTLGQDRLAAIVLRHLQTHDNAKVVWSRRVTGVTQGADDVTVHTEGELETQSYTGRWLVAGDGGRSAVRKAIGLTLEGITWPQRFVATDMYYDFEKHGWNSGYLVDPVYGAVVYKVRQEGMWRFTFAEDASLPLEGIEARIAAFAKHVLPGDKNYDMVLFSPYNMHQRHAPSYRSGRVLLAGDAAHLTNPTSGFGLMGGMYDSFLLSEALAAVVKDGAGEEMLDRYSQARRHVYETVTSPVSSESLRLVFNSHDPDRLASDLAVLRDRKKDPDAMRKFLSVPVTLESPSLVSGRSLAERAARAA